jgi:hypothetical protein
MMHLLHKSHALKKNVVHAARAVMHVRAVTVRLHVAHAVPQEPMPHRLMAAINPLTPPMLPKPPSSAFVRSPRPHPLARLRTDKENKHAATSAP